MEKNEGTQSEATSGEKSGVDQNSTGAGQGKADPVRRLSKIIAAIVLSLFVWYVAADRLAPWTDQARVQAYVVPIVAEVSGKVTEINVGKDQEVQPGDVLVKIDPRDYQLAVQSAESALELAGQEIGAGTASVATAQSHLVEEQANLAHVQIQSNRIFEVEKKGVVSKSDGDKARAALQQAKAQVESAESELEKAKRNLGQKGQDNPRIRSAIAKLKQAQLDLSRTIIYAPSHGGITNLKIDVGYYAKAGSPVMTFIEVENVWIQANLRENSVANIRAGNAVDIALDVAPGHIFKGRVTSIGFAVSHETGGNVGELAKVEGASGWLRDAQRFPVIIKFDDERACGYRRLGGQADVQIYGSSSILNGLGWIWIRILSWVSYVY